MANHYDKLTIAHQTLIKRLEYPNPNSTYFGFPSSDRSLGKNPGEVGDTPDEGGGASFPNPLSLLEWRDVDKGGRRRGRILTKGSDDIREGPEEGVVAEGEEQTGMDRLVVGCRNWE